MNQLLGPFGRMYGFTPEQIRDCTPEEIDLLVSHYNAVMKAD